MILFAFAVVAVLLAGVLLYASTRPDSFRVERSAVVAASPVKLFPLINDLKRWEAWSPWEKLDPAMKKTFSGAASGKGAVYDWEGNGKVGAGRMEITESVPVSKIAIKLDFLKPFEGHNSAEFTLAPDGGTTKVTWAMFGSMVFLAKVMSVFASLDGMIGKDFEIGLANLKAAAEK